MSAVASPAHILLTGGSGFIGSAVLSNLLSKGYTVRAAVRTLDKSMSLQTTFKSYADAGKLTFVIIPDMTVPDAFDSALQGIDGVIHCASPMPPTDTQLDPERVTGPAISITTGILSSAAKNPSIKRVVITSSVMTLYEPKKGRYVYSEADWFDTAPKLLQDQGVNATGGIKYIASKVLAERAAWEWVERKRPSFQLVTVLPPWVWGKSVTANPEHIRPEASSFHLLQAISRANAGTMDAKEYLFPTQFADVLDVAEGHIKALSVPAAAGERFTLRGGFITWQDALDIINAKPIAGLVVPKGVVGSGKGVEMEQPFSAAKSTRVLGMTYRPIADTVHDTVVQAVELGWSIEDTSKGPVW